MDSTRLRIVCSAAVAFVAVWFFSHGDPGVTELLIFPIPMLIAYRVWPAFAANLLADFMLRVTPGAVAAAILVSSVFTIASIVWGSGVETPTVIVARFVGVILAGFAMSIVLSVVGTARRSSEAR